MALVTLNVYDITNTKSDLTNATIQHLNTLTKDTFNAGGIFHGGIEVHVNTLIFVMLPRRRQWAYRVSKDEQRVRLSRVHSARRLTSADATKVRAIVAVMKASWPGNEYEGYFEELQHVLQAFTALGVPPSPLG